MTQREKPIGYHVQEAIPCCAGCVFGGYIGGADGQKMYICEIMGEITDSRYEEAATDPLGICDAYKFLPRRARQ